MERIDRKGSTTRAPMHATLVSDRSPWPVARGPWPGSLAPAQCQHDIARFQLATIETAIHGSA